jgi:hypothetical protein
MATGRQLAEGADGADERGGQAGPGTGAMDAVMVKSHRQGSRNQQYHPLSFGGWGDYQAWADNDFVQRPPDPDPPEVPPQGVPVHENQDYVDDEVAATDDRPAESREPDPSGYEENDYPAPSPHFERVVEPPDEIDSRITMARPYVRTGGRARADHDLRIETMISTKRISVTGYGRRDISTDHQLICRVCEVPKSVAEIAAYIQAPLGVARVLIGDAITANLLTIHEPVVTIDGRPSMELLQRVYAGLVQFE